MPAACRAAPWAVPGGSIMGNIRTSVLLVLAGAVSLVLALGLLRAAGVRHQPADALAVWG